MKFIQTILLCLLISGGIFAQQFDERIAPTREPISDVELAEMPAQDNEALLQAELERRGPGIAPHFAVPIDVHITPQTHGTWETLNDGTAVWRLRIKSAGAKSLNFGFTKYFMPHGGNLIIYSVDKKKVMGPFTPADNEEHEQLWTPVFEADEVVIEVQVPDVNKDQLDLELKSVNHDFLGFTSIMSGSCNLDVICGADDGWGIVDNYRDIIQSVAVYGNGGFTYCTGFLVNNTRNDCTPLFMTANHCMGASDAPTLVVYWNYINSFCRQPNTSQSGAAGDGSLDDFNTGSIYRASYSPTDFMLVELDDDVSETANAFFAGWNAEFDLPGPDTVIAVHHPSTDEKRISFEFDQLHPGEWGNGGTEVPGGNHVVVPDWDIGTTEGGSSGSPLFDGNKRVIGQLHGGGAACGNDQYDIYGWVAYSWEGGGTSSSRLKDWLDPDDTGVLVLDGRDQAVCSFAVIVDNPNSSICASEDVTFDLGISEAFTEDVTLSIEGVPGDATAVFSNNPAAPGSSLNLSISNTADVTTGTYQITITGVGGDQTVTSDIFLTIYAGAPAAVTLTTPANNAEGEVLAPPFSWEAIAGATTYNFVLASDPDFMNIIYELETQNTDIQTGLLESETTYYWMVTGSNLCGVGTSSEVFSFTTSAISCGQVTAQDLPVEISDSGEVTVTSQVNVNLQGLISDVRIDNLDIPHTWVGDLTVTLTSPEGTIITIFDRPGVPESFYGCDGSNIIANFYDTAPNSSDDFENTCGDDPAISGDYQPIDPFSTLIGESADGPWTLTISDAFNQDGGELSNWDLTICTAVPEEIALFSSEDTFSDCMDQPVTFEILAGTGFTGETIDLSAENLPEGASVGFSANPIAPGESVTVTISGATVAGTFAITIIGNDGTNMASLPIFLDLNGPPAPANMMTPANGAMDTPIGLTLTWEDALDANSYIVTVASDPDFNNIVVSNTQANASYPLSGLDYGTTYYWSVQTIGMCGSTEPEAAFSFTTVPDVNVAVNPTQESACLTDELAFDIEVGSGFSTPLAVDYTTSTGEMLTVNYSVDPANVTPGSTITATVSGFASISTDLFELTFTFDDGTYSSETSAQIALEYAPGLPVQTFPANNASFMDPNITLLWDGTENSEEYLIEVSDSDLFENIVESATVSGTLYSLTNITDPGIYYWRVTALNGCGSSITSALTFAYTPNSTQDFDGRTVSIAPNPTSGELNIQLSQAVDYLVTVEIFSIDGKVIQSQFLDKGQSNIQLDLSGYASGVYLVKLTDGNARLTRRVIVQE